MGVLQEMKKNPTVNLTVTALCIALGLILPVFFHMIGAGPAFLPMHLPVLLCGLLLGWQYGAVCGLVVPLLSSLLTGMPPFFPTALAMMLELCAYGVRSGMFHRRLCWSVYFALIAAMLGGRVVSGIADALLLSMAGKPYGFAAFLSGTFAEAVPGIVVQIVLLPVIVLAMERAKIFQREKVS